MPRSGRVTAAKVLKHASEVNGRSAPHHREQLPGASGHGVCMPGWLASLRPGPRSGSRATVGRLGVRKLDVGQGGRGSAAGRAGPHEGRRGLVRRYGRVTCARAACEVLQHGGSAMRMFSCRPRFGARRAPLDIRNVSRAGTEQSADAVAADIAKVRYCDVPDGGRGGSDPVRHRRNAWPWICRPAIAAHGACSLCGPGVGLTTADDCQVAGRRNRTGRRSGARVEPITSGQASAASARRAGWPVWSWWC
jgi:hypothetical protein